MKSLQYLALVLLSGVFFYRLCSAIVLRQLSEKLRDRKWILPWLACGLGAMAMLTQGGIWSQRVLDAPLGGTNVLKLVQDVLTIVAFALGAWTALDLDDASDRERHPARWALLAAMVAGLCFTFFLTTNRGSTNYFYVETNQSRPTVWLFAVTYIAELLAVTVILLAGVWHRKPWPYWLFRVGSVLVIAACLFELVDLSASITPLLKPIRGLGRALFDPSFYPGVALIIIALVVFAAIRWRRDRHILGYVVRMQAVCSAHQLPVAVLSGSTFESLAQVAVTLRDAYLAGLIPLMPPEVALLNSAEEFIERELSHLIDLGDYATIAIEPERLI